MITNNKQRDWDKAAAVDFSELGVGNSAKHGSLNSSGEGEEASSKGRKNDICLKKPKCQRLDLVKL